VEEETPAEEAAEESTTEETEVETVNTEEEETPAEEAAVEESSEAETTEATDETPAEDTVATEETTEGGSRRLEAVIDHKTLFFADTSTIVFDNILEIASVADVSCSFAGGCQYEVTGVGVSTLMANSGAHIRMCDEECHY
jgi:hypothetical protein